jgi:hypothetical protein
MKHIKRIFENRISFALLSNNEVVKEIDWKDAHSLSEIDKMKLEDYEIEEIKKSKSKLNLLHPIIKQEISDSEILFRTSDEVLKISKYYDDWFLISYLTAGGEKEKYWILDTIDFYDYWLKNLDQKLTESLKFSDVMNGNKLWEVVDQPTFYGIYFNSKPESLNSYEIKDITKIVFDYVGKNKDGYEITEYSIRDRMSVDNGPSSVLSFDFVYSTRLEVSKFYDDYWGLFFHSTKRHFFVLLDTLEGLEMCLQKLDPLKL